MDYTEEFRQKVADDHRGRIHTDQSRQSMSTRRKAAWQKPGARGRASAGQGGPSLCGFKVSLEMYDAVLASKPDVCDCCGRPPTKGQPLCLDHDHSADHLVLRGWLHRKCNGAIGVLGDDLPGLELAVAYLQREPLWSL